MDRILRGATWFFFGLLAYFIIAGGILHPWIELPVPGDLVFVPIFSAFSLLHAGRTLGGRRAALFFGLTVVISYLTEEIGVRTGLVYGPYHYSDMLGPKLDRVPVLIPLGWFMMIYPSWVVAQSLLRGVDLRRPAGMVILALTAALAMTGWDMVMDPPMIAAGNWIWEEGGPYFGVPLRNYFGWVLNSFLVYLAFGLTGRGATNPEGPAYRFEGGVFGLLPLVIYTLFAVQYLSPTRRPELVLVAVFSMLMPGALALARQVLPHRGEAA